MTADLDDMVIPCTECAGGRMHREFVTYFTWMGDEMITVPDFPAWVCDVCGRRDYDMGAMTRLSLLLSPNAGQTPQHRTLRSKKKASPKGKSPSSRPTD